MKKMKHYKSAFFGGCLLLYWGLSLLVPAFHGHNVGLRGPRIAPEYIIIIRPWQGFGISAIALPWGIILIYTSARAFLRGMQHTTTLKDQIAIEKAEQKH